MRSFVRLAVLAAGALLAAACAGQSTIYNNMLSGGYRPYVFGYAAGRRDLTTVIVGDPFEIDQAELEPADRHVEREPELPAADPLHHHPGPSARPEFQGRASVEPAVRAAKPGLPHAAADPRRRSRRDLRGWSPCSASTAAISAR